MKLFISPGACSLSPHIALREAGLPFTTELVDLRTKRTAGGADFSAINPKGYVPALQLDDGSLLTEGPAIVQYIADRAPERALAPAAGTLARYRLAEWLNFISSEVHKAYGPLFNPASGEDMKSAARAALAKRFTYINAELATRDYLVGGQFSVADGYLFTVTNWAGHVAVPLEGFSALQAFQDRVGARPMVQQALRDEGLIP